MHRALRNKANFSLVIKLSVVSCNLSDKEDQVQIFTEQTNHLDKCCSQLMLRLLGAI